MKIQVLFKKSFFTSFLVGIFLFGSTHIAFAERITTDLPSGVRYISDTTSTGNPIRLLIVDTTQALVSIEGPGDGSSCDLAYTQQQLRDLDSQTDLVAVMNALFVSGGQSVGDYLGNRIFYGNSNSLFNVSIDHAGQIRLGIGDSNPGTEASAKLKPADVSNFSMFMQGGYRIDDGYKRLNEMTDEEIRTRFNRIYSSVNSNATQPIARTILGVDTNGHRLFLFTSGDGLTGRGILPVEAVHYLVAQGATAAFNLDSGGSTFMRIPSRLAPGVSLLPRDDNDHAQRSIITVRARGPRTEAETRALPQKDCSSDHHGVTQVGSQPPVAPSQPQPGQTQPQPPVSQQPVPATTQQQSQAGLPPQTIALEVPIGDVSSISGAQNYILSYSRILFGYATGLAGTLALLMLIISGFQIMVGGPEQIGKAKERIVGSLAGLIILASGGFLLYMINPCFFNFSTTTVCTPRGTASSSVNVVNQAPASGNNAGVSGGNGLSTDSGTGPFANADMMARVVQLATQHAALPPLVAGSGNPPVPARSIAYPTRDGGYRYYHLTDDDKLWMGRMVEYEGGASNINFGKEIVWIVVQRFYWEGQFQAGVSFDTFMRAFSQPINASITTHPEALSRSYESLSDNTKTVVDAFFAGTLPNPVPGIVDFASQASPGVGMRCADARNPTSSVVYVRNNSTRTEPSDHSHDDCNASADHLYVGRHAIGLSTDQGYERIQVSRPAS